MIDGLPFPEETLHRRKQEIEKGDMKMPIIRVDWIEGRTLEQKRSLAAKITEVVCECARTTPDRVTVIINDIPKTNHAKAGVLRADHDQ